jgi:hypothetical protein
MLLCSVFLQKIALPGTGGLLPINLFIFPSLTLLAFLFGTLVLNLTAFSWYALFILIGALSGAISTSAHVSPLSLGFLLVVQFPLAFRFASSEFTYQRLLNFLSVVGCVCALLGCLQFGAQFVVGSGAAFFVDTALPDNFVVKQFNSMIPLYWSSPVFKSNGVVFLEPSFFSQFLAVAVVAELLVGARTLRLMVLAAGLISSYSGTGLTTLALFIPLHFLRKGQVRLFLTASIVFVALIFFGDVISIETFTRRLGEFSDVQSSGWARFLSMFSVLQSILFVNDFTFLTGRGPGTVQEQFQQLSYYAFDPTWGKVIYEYGLLGSLVYVVFFYFAFCRGAKGLRFAMGYTYFFLGGYLLNAAVLMQMAALVVWFNGAGIDQRQTGSDLGFPNE